MIGWAITPEIMRSPFAELTRTLEEIAAAGIEAVEFPIDTRRLSRCLHCAERPKALG